MTTRVVLLGVSGRVCSEEGNKRCAVRYAALWFVPVSSLTPILSSVAALEHWDR